MRTPSKSLAAVCSVSIDGQTRFSLAINSVEAERASDGTERPQRRSTCDRRSAGSTIYQGKVRLTWQFRATTAIKQVAEFIGLNPLLIPSTNAVFTRSRNVVSHPSWAEDRRATLAVHRILASTIQPEKLWFMGNPDKAGEILTVHRITWQSAEHKDWSIGHGTVVYGGHPVTLCHTPHLSRWDPTGKENELRFAFGLSDKSKPS